MNKVKGYRNMANLTQEEMAKALNISVVSYNLKEKGEREFTQSEMVAFVEKIKTVVPSATLDLIFMENMWWISSQTGGIYGRIATKDLVE